MPPLSFSSNSEASLAFRRPCTFDASFTHHHARFLEGVAKSHFLLKAVVFKSQKRVMTREFTPPNTLAWHQVSTFQGLRIRPRMRMKRRGAASTETSANFHFSWYTSKWDDLPLSLQPPRLSAGPFFLCPPGEGQQVTSALIGKDYQSKTFW